MISELISLALNQTKLSSANNNTEFLHLVKLISIVAEVKV